MARQLAPLVSALAGAESEQSPKWHQLVTYEIQVWGPPMWGFLGGSQLDCVTGSQNSGKNHKHMWLGHLSCWCPCKNRCIPWCTWKMTSRISSKDGKQDRLNITPDKALQQVWTHWGTRGQSTGLRKNFSALSVTYQTAQNNQNHSSDNLRKFFPTLGPQRWHQTTISIPGHGRSKTPRSRAFPPSPSLGHRRENGNIHPCPRLTPHGSAIPSTIKAISKQWNDRKSKKKIINKEFIRTS